MSTSNRRNDARARAANTSVLKPFKSTWRHMARNNELCWIFILAITGLVNIAMMIITYEPPSYPGVGTYY